MQCAAFFGNVSSSNFFLVCREIAMLHRGRKSKNGKMLTPSRRLPIRRYTLALESLEQRIVPSVDVTRYHYDNQSTGANLNETQLTSSNVNSSSFGKLYSTSVDGQVYAEPLEKTNVTITGANAGTYDSVVFVATQNDSLYAINAATGAVLWQRIFLDTTNANDHLSGATSVTTVSSNDVNSTDINPQIGITGTPVIDPSTNLLYLDVKTKETVGANAFYVQRVHAINIANGTDAANAYVLGTTENTDNNTNNTQIYVPGTGDGNVGGVVQFNALREANRPALSLVNGTVYLAFASHGDNGPYHGWVVTLNVANLSTQGFVLTGVLNVDPNGGGAGIWNGAGGLTFEPDNSAFYFETGNGFGRGSNPTSDANGFPTDHSYYESLVKVVNDPTTTASSQNSNGWGLKIVDYFTPYNVVALDNADEDFGSGSPLVLPDSAGIPNHPHLMVAAGKEGKIYLLDRTNLGKFNANGDNVLNAVPNGSGQNTAPVLINGSLSTPAYYHGELYWVSGYNNRAWSYVIGADGTIQPVSETANTNFGYLPGSVIVSANGSEAPGGGIAWIADTQNNELHAYSTLTLNTELWNSNQNAGDALGTAIKFAVPTEANGQVFVGTSNSLVAYGLKGTGAPVQAPNTPGNLSAQALSGSSVELTWTDSSVSPNFASNYIIQDSTNNVNFATVANAGQQTTSYTVTGLSQSTTYFFRIAGSNSAGTSAFPTSVSATTTSQTGSTPTAPVGLSGTPAGPSEIFLNWNNTATNQTGFTLTRATDSLLTQNVVTQTLGAAPYYYTDTAAGMTPGNTYYYKIQATNSSGSSSSSNTAGVSIPNVPPQPTNASAVVQSGNSSILVSWTDHAGPLALGYQVFRSVDGGASVLYQNVPETSDSPPSTQSFTDTSVALGHNYSYQIMAHNVAGFSAAAIASTSILGSATLTIDGSGNLAFTVTSSGVPDRLVLQQSGSNYILADSAVNITVSGAGSGGVTGSGTSSVTIPASAVNNMTLDTADNGNQVDSITILSDAVPVTITADSGSGIPTINLGDPTASNTLSGNINNLSNGALLIGGSGTTTISGNLTSQLGGVDITGSGTVNISGNIALNGGNIQDTGSATATVSGVVSGSASGTAGLIEGQIGNNGFDTTDLNPGGLIEPRPYMAEVSSANQATPPDTYGNTLQPQAQHLWVDNQTWVYTGQIFFPNSNGDGTGTMSFGKNIDDNTLLKIDGTSYINNTSWNTPVSSGPITLATGWHNIEMRFGNGGGGAGAVAGSGWTNTFGFGFRVDSGPSGDPNASSTSGSNYFIPDNNSIPPAYVSASYFPSGLFRTNGPGGVVMNGSGTLTLSGNNTYAGSTLIQAGKLVAAVNNALGNTVGGVVVSGTGILSFPTAGGLNYTTPEPVTLSSNGTGNGAIENVSGNNSFAGPITLTSNASVGSDSGTLTLSGNIALSGQTLTVTGAGNTVISGVVSGNNTAPVNGLYGAYYTLPAASNQIQPASASNASWLGNQTPAATALLAGVINFPNISANSFLSSDGHQYASVGGTNVEARWYGSINIPNNGVSGNPISFATTSDDGSMLYVDGNAVVNNNFFQGPTQRTGLVNLTPGLHTIDIEFYQGGGGASMDAQWDPTGGTSFVDIPFSAFFIAPTNGLTKTGAGTLSLSNSGNSYTGATTINQGYLVASSGALGTTAGGVVVNAGGTLAFSGNYSTPEPVTINGSGPSGNGAIDNLSGSNSFNGPITLGSNAAVGSAAGTLTLTGSTINLAGFNLASTGAGNKVIADTISGTSVTGGAYVGFTGATGGANAVQNILSWNYTSGSSTVDYSSGFSGSTLQLNGGATIQGTALQLTDGNNNEARSAFTPAIVNVGVFDTTFKWTYGANPTADGFTFTIQNTGSTAVGAGGGGLGYQGIGNSLALQFNLYNNVSTFGVGLNGNINHPTDLTASGINFHTNPTDTYQAVVHYDGVGTLTVTITDTTNGQTTGAMNISAVVPGSSANSLIQSGSGTTNLTANDTYIGNTTISAGLLAVDGTLTSSPISIASGGTLGGTGTVGAFSASSGGTVSPGDTAGAIATLTTGSITLSSGSTYQVDIGATTSDSLAAGSNSVNLGSATLGLNLPASVHPALNQIYTIIISNNAVTGTFSGLAQGGTVTVNNYQFTISYTGGDGSAHDVVLKVTSTPSTAVHLAFLAQPGNTTAGATVSPAVTVAVEDSNNNVITTDNSNVTIAFGTNPGSGTLSGTLTVAAVSGVATFGTLSINKTGVGYTLAASDGSFTGAVSSAFNITPGTANQLVFNQQPTNTTAGATVSPAVTVVVEDSLGNVVTTDSSSVTVAIGTNPGSGTLSGTVTVVASSGTATFGTLAINKTGSGYTLTAADGTLTKATSSAFNITPGTATQVVFGVQPSNTTAGVTISPAVTVKVEDSLGNVVTTDTSNVTVAIGTNPGSGTLGGTVTVVASSGTATFNTLSINKTGSGYTLTAADGTLTKATSNAFNLTPGTATQVAFGVQPSNTTAGATMSPAVTLQVEDSLGNVVTTDTSNVTVAIGTNPSSGTLSGTLTVAASSGTATFSTLSIDKIGAGYTLTAADGTLTKATSNTFSITPGAAKQLVLGVQPSNTTAGATISPAVTVKVEDSLGNVVTTDHSNVTVAIGTNPGGGTLSGTVTLAAVSGSATFSALSINKTGVGYTLTAADGALSNATSSAFNITPGAATQVVFGVQPSNTAAGATISPAVTVKVEDSLGNVVTTDSSSVTLALGTNPGSGTLSGTLTVAASSGTATFSTLSINKTGTGYTLTAADGSLTQATSAPFNVTPGTATQVVFGVQPSNTTAGKTISPAVTAQVEDSLGNVVTTDTSNVTVAIGTNPGSGTLSGTVTVAASSGVATFSTLSINKTGVGYTLTTADGTLTKATSAAFSITPGTAAQVVFGVQPSNTTANAAISPAVTVQVQDSLGNVVTTDSSTVTVAIGANPGGGLLSGILAMAATSGTATFNTLSINKTGVGYTLTAADGTLTSATSSAFNITPGTATQVVFGVQPGNTTAGQTISPAVTVLVEDSLGNVVTTDSSGVTVAIGTNPGSGTLGGTLTVAASSGVATFSTLSINKAGLGYKLTAADGALSNATTSAFNITPGSATQVVFGVQPSNTAAGATISPAVTVKVEDSLGNVVTTDSSNVTVAIGANPGSGTLGGTTTVAAVGGVATLGTLSINKAGVGYTLTAADGALTNATSSAFNVTLSAATKVVFGVQPSSTGAGAIIAPALTVKVEDSLGNVVTTDTSNVTLAIGTNPGSGTLGGTLTVAAVSGIATFSTLSINKSGVGYTLTAADGSDTGATSSAFNITPGAATQLVFNQQPTNTMVGATISPAVTVQVEDSLGNVVTGDSSNVSVVIAANPGSGTLSGTATVAASSGIATFGTLSINKAGVGYTLTTVDGSLAGATSSAFNITAVATHLVFTSQPGNTTAGSTIAPAVTVAVEDTMGNIMTGDSSSVTLAIGSNPGSGTLSGTVTVNAVSGIATFSTLSINKSGSGYTLTAADGGLTAATSASFNITAGHANHLAVIANPTTTTAGVSFLLTVTAQDNQGNTDTTYNSTVTFSSSDPLAPTPAAPLALSGGQGFVVGTLYTAATWTVAASGPGASGSSGNITVQPNTATHYVVATTANPAITGSPISVTVTAEDQYSNVATGYTGNVSLTSSDAAATFTPNPYTFMAADAGVHTFSATLNTPGSQTITARDTANGSINGTSSAITTRGLEVSSVTVTPNGLNFSFNKAFNPSVLNLYDGGSNLLGPSDLVLTGANTGGPGVPGVLEGSVVVTSPTTLTFLYSFGVMPDDNYTLVLRSAANGFVDMAGVPLDGNNSGVPGTNYTTSFSTSFNANDVGLVVGSFARGPAQTVSLVVPFSTPSIYYPGLPIQLTDGNNATTAGFTLTYNTALLNVSGAAVDTSGAYASAPSGSTFTRTSHTVVSGIATDVFAFSTNGHGNLATGHGAVTIGELQATIPNTTNQTIYKAKQVLAVSGATGNGALPLVGASAIQVVGYPADASGDGAYAGNDASLTGRVAGGQDTGFAAWPLVDPVVLADLAGEGVVTATDASQVAQVAVHRPGLPNITPVPPGAQVAPSTAPDPLLSLPTGKRVSTNGTVSVPVNLDEARPVGSTGLTEATLALRFDPSVFTVSSGDIHLGSIPQGGNGWTLTSSVNDVTGQIGITLYSLTPIASNVAGSLVMIDFHAQPGAAVGTSSVQLAATVDPSGHGSYVTNVADSNGAMILGIAPTNVANPVLDGTVVVLASPVSAVTVLTSTSVVASVEPEVVVSVTPVVSVVVESSSSEESSVPAMAAPADASAARVGKATAHPANAVATLLSQAAAAVFQVGLPAVALPAAAPALSEQHLADRVFQAAARGVVDLADLALVGGTAQDAMSQYLGSRLSGPEDQGSDPGDFRLDDLELSADLGPSASRTGRREAVNAQAPAARATVTDPSALSQYFALLAVEDDGGVEPESD
jgi:autotransporter-associated beta strand protein